MNWLTPDLKAIKRLNTFIVAVVLLLPINSSSQVLSFPRRFFSEQTVAGELCAVLSAPEKWNLQLHGAIIYQDDSVPMEVLKHIRQRNGSFDEVVVLQRREGTYCIAGTFWFLGLRKDGSFHLSDGVGDCFAYELAIATVHERLTVSVRGGYGRNRLEGEPYLPGGTWEFRDGKVKRIERRSRRSTPNRRSTRSRASAANL